MSKVEIIILQTEDEYRREFNIKYVGQNFKLGDIPVVFVESDFDHIFWEPGKTGSGYRFSKRRAKRMYFMAALLSGEFQTEIMLEIETGNIAIFCEDLECVMYLRVRVGSGKLQVGTFFDFGKGHTKMLNKQKKKCAPITLPEFKTKYMQ